MTVLCARVSMGASGLVSGGGALRAGPVAGGLAGGVGEVCCGQGREGKRLEAVSGLGLRVDRRAQSPPSPSPPPWSGPSRAGSKW